MAGLIEDYAIIGNGETVALVCRDGSIDWLGLPRFDSPACFAGLLGTPDHGRWRIAPEAETVHVTRSYRGPTLVLETVMETADGAVCLTDCMYRRDGVSDVIRRVRGLRGRVSMQVELVIRFDYGASVPWVTREDDGAVHFIAGPDRVVLRTGVEMTGKDMRTIGMFDVQEGEEVDFVLSWTPSYRPLPTPLDVTEAIENEIGFWSAWAENFHDDSEWSDAVLRSAITLKALAHRQTGGIVAAGTTSLPESIGGERNWDYRLCWLRDATLTLYALMGAGFIEEAQCWSDWLLRAIAGSPDQLQIVYGVGGERRLDEYQVPWLPGYEGSSPVRIGNAAAGQLQLDVYGEIMDALYLARKNGLSPRTAMWDLEIALVTHLETIWNQEDDGIWEVRGPRQHFTHSKVMAWVAFDRAVRSAEEFNLDGPLDRWREIRDRIHADVCRLGFDAARNSFVQAYGSSHLDASLLMIPLVGFLPPEDDRVRGTVAAVEQALLRDGFVMRYDTGTAVDGLLPGEGAFLACSFWLADNYVLLGRLDDARTLFERLLALRNDLGLLAEEYDPRSRRQVGNFPQAFSHIALINTAHNICHVTGPAQKRAGLASAGPSGQESQAAGDEGAD